jgi:hypothetical protein
MLWRNSKQSEVCRRVRISTEESRDGVGDLAASSVIQETLAVDRH